MRTRASWLFYRSIPFRLMIVSIVFFIGFGTLAAAAPPTALDRLVDSSILKNLEWRNIGPAIMGGRIDDFAVVESQPHIIYVATASGGLWKTVNNGVTWEPLFDREAVSTIGDVTVAPSNPSIVWLGTGEPNNRQSSSWGNGVYKSTDAGKTWTHMGLADTHHIGRIVVDPHNPDVAYVAALGRLWGPNKERGLFKTTDAGKTWVNTQFINEDTGFVDVAIDLESPNILYAAAYQRRRAAHGFNGGGPHSGLYRTTDGGATWVRLTQGLPEGDTGRIGIDIYRRNPNIVYAIIENRRGGVFRSEDKGMTWKKMSPINPRPMYYSKIRIDPNNDQRIWVLGASMYVSDDGGKTFRTDVVTRVHGDFHAMWIDPSHSDHMMVGSDGGIYFSYDRGRGWDFVNTLPLGQFYEIGVDLKKPYNVYGGLQDNGSWGGPSRTLYTVGITNEDWFRVGGGDGFYVQVDPSDPTILYVESQNGNVSRLELKTGERRSIRPEPKEGEKPYRFDWNTPLVISAHDPKTIYLGGNRLFKSTDRGDTWTATEDLSTAPDRDKLPIMGVIPNENTLSRHDGVESYGQIITLAESPLRKGLLYVGTDDGNLQVSRDDGATWKNVIDRVPGVPKNTYVSRVIASRFVEGRAYVTLDGHRSNNFTPYVYVTEDYGESWRSIAANLPPPGTVNVLREHIQNPNLLFVGTEFGAYFSIDRGGNWVRFEGNLPTVPVDDIAVHPRENDLIFATHGRGIWILDDITPLEQLSADVLASDFHLSDIRPSTSYRLANHKGNTGHKFFVAPNPPNGALISYHLKSSAQNDVKITILDTAGKTIRELNGSKEAGLKRLAWDLRYARPTDEEERPGGFFGPPQGPLLPPGEYVVRLSVEGKQMEKRVRVEEDPRIEISEADRKVHLEAQLQMNQLYRAADKLRNACSDLFGQLNTTAESLKARKAPESLMAGLTNTSKEVDEIRRRLAVPPRTESAGPREPGPTPILSRLRSLIGAIGGYTARPTAVQLQQIEEISRQLSALVSRFNNVVDVSIPELNKQMLDHNVPFIAPVARVEVP